MVVVGDLSGSGGAERHFADLHQYLRGSNRGTFQLITARASLRRLRESGRLASDDGVVALPLGNAPAQSRVNILWTTLCLLWSTIGRGIDVVHICLPTPTCVPYAALVTRLPRSMRPAVVTTVLDCTLAPNLLSGRAADRYEQQVIDAHRWYDRWARLDGIFSWYRAFGEAASRLRMFTGALIESAAYCFTNVSRFTPAQKERLVVYAGRLSAQKRPLLFVDAIASLLKRHSAIAAEWRFAMYGTGALEAETRRRIDEHGLAGRIALTATPDMAPVFARSKLFVSTQAYENFTSLAMLEAMAAANAIVAEDVGQTSEFVRQGENGYAIVAPATPDSFADAIADYIAHPERHGVMGDHSRRLTSEVHTIAHFADDITAFWSRVARI